MAEVDSLKTSWSEIANAVVIALSGLLVAFSTYQADLWNSEEDINFSRASILYTQAARTWDRENAREAVITQLFSHWLEAALHKDTTLANFYANRIPPDVRPAFDAWLAMDPLQNEKAPFSPLALPQYAPSGRTEAAALESQGDASHSLARQGKRTADSYAQAGTILSVSLFFAGISQVFRSRPARYALFAFAAIACAIGIVRIFTLPLVALYAKA
jgi:hypothetical protein